VADAAILAPVLLWAAWRVVRGYSPFSPGRLGPRGFGVVLMGHIIPRLRAASRAILAEPPRPPLPGAGLEPGFRRRWLWFFPFQPHSSSSGCSNLAVGFAWQTVGLDARIYYNGSAAWVAGGKPMGHQCIAERTRVQLRRPAPNGGHVRSCDAVAERGLCLGSGWPSRWPRLRCDPGSALAIRVDLVSAALFGVIAANPHVVLLALLVAGGHVGAAGLRPRCGRSATVGERRSAALTLRPWSPASRCCCAVGCGGHPKLEAADTRSTRMASAEARITTKAAASETASQSQTKTLSATASQERT